VSLKRRTAAIHAAITSLLLGLSPGLQAETGNLQFETLPPLPGAVSNNAVALLPVEQGIQLYSALGLESGKTWRDASSEAYRYSSHEGKWEQLQPVPGAHGRLAASAVVVAGGVYVFGGYTVSEDGFEQSTPAGPDTAWLWAAVGKTGYISPGDRSIRITSMVSVTMALPQSPKPESSVTTS
jgi:hypothetical protein